MEAGVRVPFAIVAQWSQELRDRDLDPNSQRGRYLRSPVEKEEDRGVQRDRKKRPAKRGVDMFRCICRHALYRVHTRVRSLRALEVARRLIEWRRTRESRNRGMFFSLARGLLNVLLLNHNARSGCRKRLSLVQREGTTK